ncbi:MAG: hypothetical protein AB1489_16605, partial [Acidobacteriota bacterium]
INGELPKQIDAAILSALAKSPQKRPPSATAFITALSLPLVEEQRKRTNIRKIKLVSTIVVAILAITAIIEHSFELSLLWRRIQVSLGWVQSRQQARSYSSLKLVSLTDGKQFPLANSPIVKASTISAPLFQTRFSPDGSLLAIYSQPLSQIPFNENLALVEKHIQTLTIWSVTAPSKLLDIKIENFDAVHDFQFSPDGRQLAIASLNEVQIVETATGQLLHRITTLENNSLVRFVPNRDDLLLIASARRPQVKVGSVALYPVDKRNSLISLWQIKGDKHGDILHQYGELEALLTIPTAKGFAVLMQWYITEMEPTRRIELWQIGEKPLRINQWMANTYAHMTIAPDSSKFALSLSNTHVIEVDMRSGEMVKEHTLSASDDFVSLRYNQQGQLLLLTSTKIKSLNTDSQVYLAPSKAFIHDLRPSNNNLLIESVESKNEISPYDAAP